MPSVAQAAAGTAANPPDTLDNCMRRVASAPALTHASCYPEVSPTAAVAAAAAAPPPPATRSPPRAIAHQHVAQGTPQPCSSCSKRRCSCLEVYVVSRSFSEFAGPVMKRLHPHAREHLVDIGICHFMTVFKTPDGQLVQFDFGPLGGDVQKAHGPLATFLRRARTAAQQQQQQHQQLGIAGAVDAATAASSPNKNHSSGVDAPNNHSTSSSTGRVMVHSPSAPSLPMASLDLASRSSGEAAAARMQASSNRPRRGVAGEIRERQLQSLPSACMYMGRTSLTIEDIRMYNAAQGRQTYTLHENDCRHYVNSLVQYTTGVERSTQHLKRHYFYSRHADTWLWYGWLIAAAQLVTDVGNWGHIQAGTAATLLAMTGRSTLSSLKTLATPMLPALKSIPALLPAATAAAAASPGAAAAAAAGSTTGTAIEGLVTTLKLPATLLLKRPLAAGAAAGGAGAAAAVLREPANDSSSTGSAAAPPKALTVLSRPLRAVGDGMSHGFRSAVMGVQRLALGPARARRQQERQMATQAASVSTAAATGSPPHPWDGSSFGEQHCTGVFSGLVRRAHLLQPFGRPGHGNNQQQQQDGEQASSSPVKPFGHFRHHISRHVMWLESAAANAPGQLALLAMGGTSFTATASAVVAPTPLSAGLQPQQEQQPVAGMGHRQGELSSPSLLLAAPVPAPDAVKSSVSSTSRPGGGFQTCARPILCNTGTSSAVGSVSGSGGSGSSNTYAAGGSDMTFLWDSPCGDGSSSSLCSAFISSRPAGGGRQVLKLPTPRLSWGKRASQAMIVHH